MFWKGSVITPPLLFAVFFLNTTLNASDGVLPEEEIAPCVAAQEECGPLDHQSLKRFGAHVYGAASRLTFWALKQAPLIASLTLIAT